MLEALERELVEVVVDGDNLHLDQCVVLQQLEHQLGVDQRAQVEDQVGHRDVQPRDLLAERALDVALEHLGEVARLQLLEPLHLHLVEVLAVVLAQIAHQVLIDDLIADRGRLQLAQLELDGVLIEDTLGRFLHADGSNVEDVRGAHVVDDVVGRQALQLLGLQLLGVGISGRTYPCRSLLAGQLAHSGHIGCHGCLLHAPGGRRSHRLLLLHGGHRGRELTHLRGSSCRPCSLLEHLRLLKEHVLMLLLSDGISTASLQLGSGRLLLSLHQLHVDLLLLALSESLLLLLGEDTLETLDLIGDVHDEGHLWIHLARWWHSKRGSCGRRLGEVTLSSSSLAQILPPAAHRRKTVLLACHG